MADFKLLTSCQLASKIPEHLKISSCKLAPVHHHENSTPLLFFHHYPVCLGGFLAVYTAHVLYILSLASIQ